MLFRMRYGSCTVCLTGLAASKTACRGKSQTKAVNWIVYAAA